MLFSKFDFYIPPNRVSLILYNSSAAFSARTHLKPSSPTCLAAIFANGLSFWISAQRLSYSTRAIKFLTNLIVRSLLRERNKTSDETALLLSPES